MCTDRELCRQTDRKMCRETGRCSDRQGDAQTDRCLDRQMCRQENPTGSTNYTSTTNFPQVVRKHQTNHKEKSTSITIHCHDVRVIKLLFTLESNKDKEKISHPVILHHIPDISHLNDKLNSAASSGKTLGMKLVKNVSSPAIGKRLMQTFTDKVKGNDYYIHR